MCLHNLHFLMDLNSLSALSPIDGRYRNQTKTLAPYFSEIGLFRYRVRVEIEYFISLCKIPLPQLTKFDKNKFDDLRKIYEKFSEEDANHIKDIEKTTNHDVKAVEYFLKNCFEELGLKNFSEFIHFGLTSQDINNTGIPLSLKEFMEFDFNPLLSEVADLINHCSKLWEKIPMLARTHGQPASPTFVGKEFLVFKVRLEQQRSLLESIPYSAKFGGASGNLNAHKVTYPDINWDAFADTFVEQLGMKRSFPTTQVEHYDNLAALFDNVKRINTIFIDLCRDLWLYISFGYFFQKIKDGEIGSSAMPHKVNPIDFENAEGNLGFANAIFEHLSSKLPVSRLQRDLTDSTVLRNIGVPFSHTVVAYRSLLKGLGKLQLNKEAIDSDLQDNWVVVAEAIQNILKREGHSKPYEILKDLTRKSEKITEQEVKNFIEQLKVSDKVKEELKKITPFNYTG